MNRSAEIYCFRGTGYWSGTHFPRDLGEFRVEYETTGTNNEHARYLAY